MCGRQWIVLFVIYISPHSAHCAHTHKPYNSWTVLLSQTTNYLTLIKRTKKYFTRILIKLKKYQQTFFLEIKSCKITMKFSTTKIILYLSSFIFHYHCRYRVPCQGHNYGVYPYLLTSYLLKHGMTVIYDCWRNVWLCAKIFSKYLWQSRYANDCPGIWLAMSLRNYRREVK